MYYYLITLVFAAIRLQDLMPVGNLPEYNRYEGLPLRNDCLECNAARSSFS